MNSARLTLEFDPDSDPPTGTIQIRSAGEQPFHGWIELTRGLEIAFSESRRQAAAEHEDDR